MRRTRGALLVAVVVAFACFAAPALASTTFGANLNRVPDSSGAFTCGAYDQLYNMGYEPPSATYNSCSWEFQDPATGESVFPPSGLGVISRVRVRVGNVTGPMQIVVEEAQSVPNPSDPGHPGYACCRATQLSQVFTPAPNTITTIPVDFTVRQGPDPTTGVGIDDHLALSVLARNVPIPAAVDSNAYDGGWFPAWQQQGEERYGGPAGTSGAVILFDADWDPVSSGGSTGASITLGQPQTKHNGTARVPVTVPGPGQLTVSDDLGAASDQSRLGSAAATRSARIKTVSEAVSKAGTVAVKITPTKKGAKTLRHRHKLKVTVLISFVPSGSTTPITRTVVVTLRKRR